jgi:hypothetical protein
MYSGVPKYIGLWKPKYIMDGAGRELGITKTILPEIHFQWRRIRTAGLIKERNIGVRYTADTEENQRMDTFIHTSAKYTVTHREPNMARGSLQQNGSRKFNLSTSMTWFSTNSCPQSMNGTRNGRDVSNGKNSVATERYTAVGRRS